MALNKPVKRIAIVGTGVIGASWAAEFLAHGFDVIATDPAPNAEQNLRKFVDAAWPALTEKGLAKTASRNRLSFTPEMKKAVSDADFVQENGPERPDFKIKLYADIDAATPPDGLIASSSSGITMSVTQSACKHPERCVIGHPFNPPHMVPLVEVVGGSKTSEEAVQRAIEFYASIGKKPIHVRKEVVGHIANRLQAAVYREVVHQGVVDVADADTAVCWGPGLRSESWGRVCCSILAVARAESSTSWSICPAPSRHGGRTWEALPIGPREARKQLSMASSRKQMDAAWMNWQSSATTSFCNW
jgi:3-hydroxyacyl-CoA dehydrogenase